MALLNALYFGSEFGTEVQICRIGEFSQSTGSIEVGLLVPKHVY